jgi:hypothetical protein
MKKSLNGRAALSCAAACALAAATAMSTAPARAATFASEESPTVRMLVEVPAATNPAAAPSTRPAGQAQGATSLEVTVAEVTGNVQVRTDEKQPWQAAKVGMVVNEGAEFRTGPRSSVRCTIPPDQAFTLDRLGTVKVLQALKDGNKLKTDMLMKYGRTKYSVEAAGLEHEGTISAPGATLAVRGTVMSLYDQPPFAPEAVSYTGQVRYRDVRRQLSLGSKNGNNKRTLDSNRDSVADTALNNAVIDPRYAGARTATERAYIESEVARGGVVSFDPLANITVIRDATPIRSDAQLAQSLPGQLNFVARWFGPADINLEVFAQFGDPTSILFSGKTFEPTEFLYPGYGLNHTKSGGTIAADNRGGPNGGTEIAFWNKAPKEAVYGLAALHISGQPVEVKLNAFLNGQKQSLFFLDESGNFIRTKTIDVTLSGSNFQTGLVFIPPVDLLESIPASGDDDTSSPSTGVATTTGKRKKRLPGGASGTGGNAAYSGNTGAANAAAATPAAQAPRRHR